MSESQKNQMENSGPIRFQWLWPWQSMGGTIQQIENNQRKVYSQLIRIQSD